ncbi:T9SS C-terminal target domain-containing protein [Sphingobacteriales bacterium UPWRP_1]|nr:hypothetical protein BVG80_01635 [Sphingobacteriales bacterium TSM_CSM]PSJ72949.1 T9SS C-terminal target domain-containing protein [Sphingobacteriales bacterium UPWRP_1]
MKKNLPVLLACFISMCALQNAAAQTPDTYTSVYNLLVAKCSGCHGGSSPDGNLNLSAAPATVYNSLVNANPVNPAALAKGHKRIAPGYPRRSFLLRKINHNLDPGNNPTTGEGNAMPPYPNPALADEEIELLRQWVLHGAPQTGYVADTALIHAFYNGEGLLGVPEPLAPPPAGEGFQIYIGRYFVPPLTETENFIKYDPQFTAPVEIDHIGVSTVPQNHHFVIYKYYPGQAQFFPEGVRDTSFSSHGSADIAVGIAPQVTEINLPQGTAYRWEQNTVLDFNYHVVNTSEFVLGVDAYVNFYTQPVGTAPSVMYSRFFPNFNISIPWNNTDHVEEALCVDSLETNYWRIWILYTHTHRYGKDYDLFLRNDDGSQGEQIYEGFYNFDYTFNQGYYSWGVEAPQRVFDTLLQVDPRKGIIQRAVYNNYAGPDPIGFGLTSVDEMMVAGFQFVYGDPLPALGTQQPDAPLAATLQIYPNPMHRQATLLLPAQYQNQPVTALLYNPAGQIVQRIESKGQPQALIEKDNLPPGVYVCQAFTPTKFIGTVKLVVE